MPATPFSSIGRPRHDDVLTPAEWAVLAGVRDGLSNRAIAERRGCGLETVRFHLRNLRRKLRVQGRDGLRTFPGQPAPVIDRASSEPSPHRVVEQIPLIAVADMARSLRFWVDTLEFRVVSRWPDEPNAVPGWAALASGAARVMLQAGHHTRKVDPLRDSGGTLMLNFYVEGLDAFRERIATAGYRCGDVRRMFYGAREFYLMDPDRNEIAIVEFAAGGPDYLATGGST